MGCGCALQFGGDAEIRGRIMPILEVVAFRGWGWNILRLCQYCKKKNYCQKLSVFIYFSLFACMKNDGECE